MTTHRAATNGEGDDVQRARLQFFAMLGGLSDGFMIQDENGHILYANEAAARLSGQASAAAMMSEPVGSVIEQYDLVGEDGLPFPLEQLPARRVLAGERQAEATIGGSRPGEPVRWSHVTASAIVDWRNGRRVAVSVFRDITQQRLLEEAQREAIAVRDRFLSTASHELRTPLTSLKAQLQLGLRRLQAGVSPDTIAEHLTSAIDQVDKLAQLIDGLLDVSRLTNGQLTLELEAIELGPLVAQLVERERVIEPFRTVTYVAPAAGDPLRVLADELRLEQILGNLLSNARKYSPPDTAITVTLRADSARAYVAVRDDGIGIAPEEQARIFAPFQRAAAVERHYSGLGLGLAIAQELATAHGGSLSVESAPGRGSTFTLALPLMT